MSEYREVSTIMKYFRRFLILLCYVLLAISLIACSDSSETIRTVNPSPSLSYKDIQPTPTSASSNSSYSSSDSQSASYVDGYKSDGKIHVYIVGEGEIVYTTGSSFMRYIEYYPDCDHMLINMSGRDYSYANVSSSLWNSFKNANSYDSFYSENIKGNHSYWVNDYNGQNGDDIFVEYIGTSKQSSTSSSSSMYSSNTYNGYSDEYYECISCERTYHIDELYETGYGELICESCLDSGDFCVCEYCEEIFYLDDVYDLGGEYICYRCIENANDYEYYDD